ncbi:MAG: hypothetical protein OXU61_00975 [Gammaproteobacteria bacterium]|nr:hypothetical protein [Gammaproteobacteria bacterium]
MGAPPRRAPAPGRRHGVRRVGRRKPLRNRGEKIPTPLFPRITPPHRSSRRLTAWLLRLPLQGGVMGKKNGRAALLSGANCGYLAA